MSVTSQRPVGPVAVVVVNYDGREHLPPCLEAVAAMRGEVAERIVVDNGSTDGSLELLRERFPGWRVLALGRNLGPAAARNAGMRAASTRWVLALDNDVVVAPDTLEKLAAAVEARPEIALAQPRGVFDAEPDRVHYDGGAFHYVGLFALRNFYRPLEGAEGEGVVEVGGVVSLALLVDREFALSLGGYDERMFILFEDLDLSYRVRLAGRACVVVEDALVRHRAGTPGISFREGPRYPARRAFLHSRNRWLFLARCYRVRTLLAALPGLALYELAWLAFTTASGHLLPHLRGRLAFLRLLPSTLRLRRETQRGRVARDRDLLVGGPWTTTPGLSATPARAAAVARLDRALAAWWKLLRGFAG